MQVNGIHYHVDTIGNGPKLMLLHGFTGSSSNWELIATQLSKQFTVITPDILGHGKTESPTNVERYTMEIVAQDIVQIIGDDPIHLLGYSMGGRLALYIAIHYPHLIQSLILESSSPGLRTEMERAERRKNDNALAQRILDDGIEQFVNFWESIPLFESQNNLRENIRNKLRTQRLTNNPLGLANSLRAMGTGSQPSLWDYLPDLPISVLLLAGNLDIKFTRIADQMNNLIPQSTLRLTPDAGHTIHLEQPDVYVQAVTEFLKS